jgi:hypothetical protein
VRLKEVQDIAAAAARAGASVPAGGGAADRLKELVRVCALVRGVLLREARPRPWGALFRAALFLLVFLAGWCSCLCAPVHVFVFEAGRCLYRRHGRVPGGGGRRVRTRALTDPLLELLEPR